MNSSAYRARKPSGRKKAAHGLLALTVLASGMFAAAPAANALNGSETLEGRHGFGDMFKVPDQVNEDFDTIWFGSLKAEEVADEFGWCVDWKTGNEGGVKAIKTEKLSSKNAAIANYIIQNKGGTANKPAKGNFVEIAAAVHELLDQNDSKDPFHRWTYTANNVNGFAPTVKTARQWIADAQNKYGPFTIAPKINATDLTGSISGLDVMSKGGAKTNTYKGEPVKVKLTLTGEAVFAASNAKTITVNAGTSPAVTYTGSGNVTVNAAVQTELPKGTVTKYIYGDKNKDGVDDSQNKIVTDGTMKPSGKHSRAVDIQSSPKVTTETSEQVVSKGASIYDNLTVSGNRNGAKLQVESVLYGPLDKKPTVSNNVPSGTPVAGKVTTPVTGNGTFKTPPLKVDKSGHYTWVETIKESATNKSWKSKFGISSETTVAKWQPKVTTETSTFESKPGAKIFDKLTVSDNDPNATQTVESTLYGPFDTKPVRGKDVPKDAPKVTTVSTTIKGNGNFNTEEVTLTKGGYYTWVEKIKESGTTESWTSEFGISDETTFAEWQPKITTETSTFVAEPGAEIFDKLKVTGNDPNAKQTALSTLYGPFDEKPVRSKKVPAGAPSVGVVETQIQGNGAFNTPKLNLPSSGYYTWVENLPKTDTTAEHQAEFGITEETTLVKWTPQVTTETSDLIAKKGAEITDKLVVTGNQPGNELDVNSTLYGPLDHRPELSDEVPEGTPEVGTVTTKVTDNGEFVTPALVVPEEGYYVWVENIEETETTDPWIAKYGISEETSVVQWKIRASTEISDRSAALDAQVFDNIWFAGFPEDHSLNIGESFKLEAPDNQPGADGAYMLPADGILDESDTNYVDLKMYWSAEEPVRSSEVPEDAVLFDNVRVPAVNGHAVSPLFEKFDRDGYYTVVTEFAGSDRVEAYTSDYGVPSETTSVNTSVPASVSTVASDDVTLGEEVFDTAYVTGDVPKGATIKYELYRFSETVDSNSVKCTEKTLVWESEKTEIEGAGTYTSDKFTPETVGTYGYVETLYNEKGEVIHRGDCGAPSETVLVNPVEKPETPKPETPKPETPEQNNYVPVNVNSGLGAGEESNAGLIAGIAFIGASLLGGGFYFLRRRKLS